MLLDLLVDSFLNFLFGGFLVVVAVVLCLSFSNDQQTCLSAYLTRLPNLFLSCRTSDQGRGTLQSSGKMTFSVSSFLHLTKKKIKQNNFVSCPGRAQYTGRQSPVSEFKRPQPQSTRVQAFSHDDFSDFDDD